MCVQQRSRRKERKQAIVTEAYPKQIIVMNIIGKTRTRTWRSVTACTVRNSRAPQCIWGTLVGSCATRCGLPRKTVSYASCPSLTYSRLRPAEETPKFVCPREFFLRNFSPGRCINIILLIIIVVIIIDIIIIIITIRTNHRYHRKMLTWEFWSSGAVQLSISWYYETLEQHSFHTHSLHIWI